MVSKRTQQHQKHARAHVMDQATPSALITMVLHDNSNNWSCKTISVGAEFVGGHSYPMTIIQSSTNREFRGT